MGGVLKVGVAAQPSRRVDRLVSFALQGGLEPATDGSREGFLRLARRRGWTAADGQRFETSDPDTGGPALELRGLGPTAALDEGKVAAALARAVQDASVAGDRRVGLLLPHIEALRGADAAERLIRGLALSGYRFDRFRQSDPASRRRTPDVTLCPPARELAAWREGSRVATVVAEAVARARDLGNAPPNEATPQWMAARTRELAREIGARVSVLGPRELARRGMGGILAVGGGSTHPPRLVRVEWGRGPVTVALVGKGVTFDTGGISIKPAAAMDEMKWDKCGACAVLGILQAVSRLRLPLRVRAYLPFAENMLGGSAYRPGDIVRCGGGKTVEILNTDAEGRLLLADALAWAASEKPDSLIELSTLTGACVVALGTTAAGLYAPDDSLAGELLAASTAAGERLWRMPLWPEFLEEMRGSHADLRNLGGRWGGANSAAAFLSQFVEPVARWAHLDIAGPAHVGGEDRSRRGATGYGVALAVRWLIGLLRRSPATPRQSPPRR